MARTYEWEEHEHFRSRFGYTFARACFYDIAKKLKVEFVPNAELDNHYSVAIANHSYDDYIFRAIDSTMKAQENEAWSHFRDMLSILDSSTKFEYYCCGLVSKKFAAENHGANAEDLLISLGWVTFMAFGLKIIGKSDFLNSAVLFIADVVDIYMEKNNFDYAGGRCHLRDTAKFLLIRSRHKQHQLEMENYPKDESPGSDSLDFLNSCTYEDCIRFLIKKFATL